MALPRSRFRVRRYDQPNPGQWIQPVRRGYKMRCCDCGLVHRMDFRVSDGRIQFRAFRDERATAAVRREERKHNVSMSRQRKLAR